MRAFVGSDANAPKGVGALFQQAVNEQTVASEVDSRLEKRRMIVANNTKL